MPERIVARGFCFASAVGLVILAGCATVEVPSVSCAPGPARPLEVGHVVARLADHGIAAARSTGVDAMCGSGVVATVTNTHFDGPHENIDDHDRIAETQGQVICHIEKKPVYPAATQRYETAKKVIFDLENVECVIYPDEVTRDRQIQNLAEAMNDLEQ